MTIVSYSELDTGRQCAYKHLLAYKERWTSPETSAALRKGTLWHAIMEVHYLSLRSTQARKPKPMSDWDRVATAVKAVEKYINENREHFEEDLELLAWMYAGYIELYGSDPTWSIVAVEYAAELYLPDPSGAISPFVLKAKIDLIVRDLNNNRLLIIDHKSGKDLPGEKSLELDDQFGIYWWLLNRLGHSVFATIHNAARTQKNKNQEKFPQSLETRFQRTYMNRTQPELDTVAKEAFWTARNLYALDPEETPRSTNPDTCYLPGTLVQSADPIQKVYRRFYKGAVVKVRTINGSDFTCTPNHPILTSDGWMAASELKPGSQLMHDSRLDSGFAEVHPNVQYEPTPIEQIWQTFWGLGVTERVTCFPMDFHGDGTEGEIDIVTPNSKLRHKLKTRTHILKFLFQQADLRKSLRSFCCFVSSFVRANFTPNTFSGHSFFLLNSPTKRIKLIGFPLSAQSNICRDKSSFNNTATNSISTSEGVYGLASQVASNYVVEVSSSKYEGHVYNLQTASGFYTAEGYTTRNCKWRCGFTDACLMARKGLPRAEAMQAFNFEQNFERH